MKNTNCSVIVFAKAPVSGQVKTRLIPEIGPDAAAALQEKLVFHSLATALRAGVGPVDLWCTPSPEHPFFVRCSNTFQVALHAQQGVDIGQRMAHAFYETFKISAYVLLMGSDCPCMTFHDLQKALSLLQRGADAVISPAEDGGYVLLGLRRYTPELFSEISWGTGFVLEQTRNCLQGLGWKWHELPERWDIDRPEDVQRLITEGYIDLREISK